MRQLIATGLFLASLIGLCQSASVVDIESSFLSQLRYELQDEQLLTRCVHVWQAVDAKLKNVELSINELRAKAANPSQVDLNMMKELAEVTRSRNNKLGRSIMAAFLDRCVEVLEEATVETKHETNGAEKLTGQCHDELGRLKAEFEREKVNREESLRKSAELEQINAKLSQELEQSKGREQELEQRLRRTELAEQELLSKLTKLESGANEASSGVESLKKELDEVSSRAQQKEAQLRREARRLGEQFANKLDDVLAELQRERERRAWVEKELRFEVLKSKEIETSALQLRQESADFAALKEELREKDK